MREEALARLILKWGDITDARVDILVNAWNRNFIPHWLLIPQGVSGALRRKAGTQPFRELRKAGLLPVGGLAETGPGNLEGVDRIFHVAALHATWRSSPTAIRAGAEAVFSRAAELQASSLAIPLLGAGTGGLPPTTSYSLIREAWANAPTVPKRTEIYIFDSTLYQGLLHSPDWEEGISKLAQHDYWQAHEEWEAIWALLPDSPAREGLQALIQFAAACYKSTQAAAKPEASMQRGMEALLRTAGTHLANAGEEKHPLQPGFELSLLSRGLQELTALLKEWSSGLPLSTLQLRVQTIATRLSSELEAAQAIPVLVTPEHR